MGQIVSWSVRDESLHTQSIVRLFRTFIAENPEVWNDDFERELYKACETIVTHEEPSSTSPSKWARRRAWRPPRSRPTSATSPTGA